MNGESDFTDEVNTANNLGSPGKSLRRSREACGFTVEEVAAHLKLGVEKIESLERGEVSSIAAPVFVAGYLRAYAKLVGLPGDEIVAGFNALTEMDSPSMNPASSPAGNNYGRIGSAFSSRRLRSDGIAWGTLSVWVSLGVVLAVGAYVFLWGRVSSDITIVENKPVLSAFSDQVSASTFTERDKTGLNEIDDSLVNLPGAESENAKTSREIDGAGKNQPKEKLEPTQSQLILMFSSESWVEVNDALEKRLLYQLAKAGSTHSVLGVAPFKVQLGYAPGARIIYNGEPYDLSHLANKRSARIRIGKAGDKMSEASSASNSQQTTDVLN